MSTSKQPLRLPVVPASLAALLLLLGSCLLLFGVFKATHVASTTQSTIELVSTVDRLSTVVSSEPGDWVGGDQLDQLIASADEQVNRLDHIDNGFFARFWRDAKTDSVRNVGANWKLLRKGLLSFKEDSLNQANANKTIQGASSEPLASTPKPAKAAVTKTTEVLQVTVPAGFAEQAGLLAESFDSIRVSVQEGTRNQSLIDLVERTSGNWAQIIGGNSEALAGLVTLQQGNADELLQLSGAGTDQSLFGYYTSNQLIDYVQSVKSIALTEQVVLVDVIPVDEPETESSEVEALTAEATGVESLDANEAEPLANTFALELLTPLQESLAGLADIVADETNGSNLINWLGMAVLAASFMLLLSAITRMTHAADVLKMRPEPQVSLAAEGSRGAMSLRQADQLIEDINSGVDGDLRKPVDLPDNSHARAIAKSANRSNAVISDLVGMTRGVSAHLNALVERQDQHGRILADLDIRRQTETAELSEGIGARSGFIDEQSTLLSGSGNLLNELSKRSESAVNGVNQVSSSLAAVSAQVEVGIERMQRLMKTTSSVTEVTAQLKQLTEKTRLQALNVSLKVPQMTQVAPQVEFQGSTAATESAYNEYSSFDEFSAPGIAGRDLSAPDLIYPRSDNTDATDMFDDIHQLTGKLVQVSNEADVLIGALQKDIQDTAVALRKSTEQMNESAHHTHSTSLLGRELASYSDQLRTSIEEALHSLQEQQSELSQTAEQIVRLDKTGNDTSSLTLALSQDLAGLQEMSSKLEESVSGFKISGEAPLE